MNKRTKKQNDNTAMKLLSCVIETLNVDYILLPKCFNERDGFQIILNSENVSLAFDELLVNFKRKTSNPDPKIHESSRRYTNLGWKKSMDPVSHILKIICKGLGSYHINLFEANKNEYVDIFRSQHS